MIPATLQAEPRAALENLDGLSARLLSYRVATEVGELPAKPVIAR